MGLNFKKPKKIPNKILKFFYTAYEWGLDDSKEGKSRKTFDQVKESINRGYSKGIQKRKN